MRDSDVVMFALGSLFGKISGKGRLPITDEFGGIEKCVAKIAGTTLLHVSISAGSLELARFVSRWREAGIGQELVRGIKAGEIPNLGQDHGPHAVADAGNGEDGRSHLVKDILDGGLNVLDLPIQLTNEPDSVLKLQRFGRHDGADGTPGGLSDFNRLLPTVASLRCVGQDSLEVCQMGVGNLPGTGKLAQYGIDRRRME